MLKFVSCASILLIIFVRIDCYPLAQDDYSLYDLVYDREPAHDDDTDVEMHIQKRLYHIQLHDKLKLCQACVQKKVNYKKNKLCKLCYSKRFFIEQQNSQSQNANANANSNFWYSRAGR